MNKDLYLILLMLCIALFDVKANAISVIPVKRDTATKWCFIDAKGNTYLENRYDGALQNTDEGTFAVSEKDGTYSLYVFDKKNPRPIARNLKGFGNFSEGVVAVIRAAGKPIEIIDKTGKTILELDSSCGKVITECSYCHDKRFVVTTIDQLGNYKVGMLDISGKVILEPIYDEIIPCDKGNYVSRKDSVIRVTDGKGGYRVFYACRDKRIFHIGKYVAVPATFGTLIIDENTMKSIAILPDANYVTDIYNGFVQYTNNSGARLVYNLKTKKALTFDKCDRMVLVKKGILMGEDFFKSEGDSMNLYSYKGKFVRKTEWTDAERYNDFIKVSQLLVTDYAPRWFLLDKNLNLIKDYNFMEIYTPFNLDPGYEYSPHLVLNADIISSILINNLHPALVDLGAIVGKTMKDKYSFNKDILCNNGHMIICQAKKDSNDVVTSASIVYGIDDENANAYNDDIYKMLCEKMDKMFKKVAEDVYEDNGIYYHIKDHREIKVSIYPN